MLHQHICFLVQNPPRIVGVDQVELVYSQNQLVQIQSSLRIQQDIKVQMLLIQ
jgi:hypothetical protein